MQARRVRSYSGPKATRHMLVTESVLVSTRAAGSPRIRFVLTEDAQMKKLRDVLDGRRERCRSKPRRS